MFKCPFLKYNCKTFETSYALGTTKSSIFRCESYLLLLDYTLLEPFMLSMHERATELFVNYDFCLKIVVIVLHSIYVL